MDMNIFRNNNIRDNIEKILFISSICISGALIVFEYYEVKKIEPAHDAAVAAAIASVTQHGNQYGESKKQISKEGGIFERKQETAEPILSVEAAGIADENGEMLFEKNSANRWPMASLTKLMTAVIAIRQMNMDQEVLFDPTTIAMPIGVKSNVIAPGMRIRIADLIKIMLTISDNQAAELIATSYGRQQFIDEMNKQARVWNMYDTHFDDPTGLSVSNQSTIHNLIIMTQHISAQYPQILQITTRPQSEFVDSAVGRTIALGNINQFAGEGDFKGGKTGYTDEAGGNLISVFSYDTHSVVVIVLGTGDRFGQTQKLFNWFKRSFNSKSP
jgi:D-alanyl-D-alanine endopeptidase (penicillin-binding protein 7)